MIVVGCSPFPVIFQDDFLVQFPGGEKLTPPKLLEDTLAALEEAVRLLPGMLAPAADRLWVSAEVHQNEETTTSRRRRLMRGMKIRGEDYRVNIHWNSYTRLWTPRDKGLAHIHEWGITAVLLVLGGYEMALGLAPRPGERAEILSDYVYLPEGTVYVMSGNLCHDARGEADEQLSIMVHPKMPRDVRRTADFSRVKAMDAEVKVEMLERFRTRYGVDSQASK